MYCLILATCYQLPQFVLKIGLICATCSKKDGIGGGGWAWSWHAVHMAAALVGYRMALAALAEPFLTLSLQISIETTPLPAPCRGNISGTVDTFL